MRQYFARFRSFKHFAMYFSDCFFRNAVVAFIMMVCISFGSSRLDYSDFSLFEFDLNSFVFGACFMVLVYFFVDFISDVFLDPLYLERDYERMKRRLEGVTHDG